MSSTSGGKAAWSPEKAMKSVGTRMPAAQRLNVALEVVTDHVDSHASAVVSRPNPTRP